MIKEREEKEEDVNAIASIELAIAEDGEFYCYTRGHPSQLLRMLELAKEDIIGIFDQEHCGVVALDEND